MKHLLWFLEAWLEWAEKIDTGEYDGGYEFDKDRGLCDNADDNFHDGVEGIDGTVVKATLATVLEKEFAHLTGNTSRYHLEAYVFSRPRHKFPFNEGSINNKFNNLERFCEVIPDKLGVAPDFAVGTAADRYI